MDKSANGVIYIHSSPAALCPHIEWAISAVLGVPIRLDWTSQSAEYGTWRAEYAWRGPVGSVTALTSALRACRRARFEVSEDAIPGGTGQRYSYTPSLGIFHAMTGENGDIIVGEQRIRAALTASASGHGSLAEAMGALLGERWDAELEVFRHAGEDAPVRWLHRVS